MSRIPEFYLCQNPTISGRAKAVKNGRLQGDDGCWSVFNNLDFRKLSTLARGASVTNDRILFLSDFPPFPIFSLMRGPGRTPLGGRPNLIKSALQRKVFFVKLRP